MSQQSTPRSTTRIRMIAADVVGQQANVCEERMKRLDDKIDSVEQAMNEVKADFASFTKEQRVQMTAVLLAVERHNTKWTFFRVLAGIVSVLGAIAGVSSLIVSLIHYL